MCLIYAFAVLDLVLRLQKHHNQSFSGKGSKEQCHTQQLSQNSAPGTFWVISVFHTFLSSADFVQN